MGQNFHLLLHIWLTMDSADSYPSLILIVGVTQSADTDRLHNMHTALLPVKQRVKRRKKFIKCELLRRDGLFLVRSVGKWRHNEELCVLWLQCQLDSVRNESDQQLTWKTCSSGSSALAFARTKIHLEWKKKKAWTTFFSVLSQNWVILRWWIAPKCIKRSEW